MESIPVNSGFETLIDMECPHCRVESLDHGNRKDTLFKLLLGASIPNRVCRSVGLSVKKVLDNGRRLYRRLCRLVFKNF